MRTRQYVRLFGPSIGSRSFDKQKIVSKIQAVDTTELKTRWVELGLGPDVSNSALPRFRPWLRHTFFLDAILQQTIAQDQKYPLEVPVHSLKSIQDVEARVSRYFNLNLFRD